MVGAFGSRGAPAHTLKKLLWRISRTAPAPGPGFRYLSVATALFIFALVTLGGIVRVTGSGLGCPDWPLCHGHIIPPLNLPTLIEYSHRLTVVVVSLLVVGTTAWAWLRYRNRLWIVVPALAGGGLLLLQIVLGGITVLTELNPGLVVAHLAVAQAFFAAYIVVAVASVAAARPRGGLFSREPGPWSPRLALAVAVLLFGAMLTGSYVTARGALAACSGWPLCDGSLWPGTPLSAIHLTHRYMVSLAGLVVVAFALRTWLVHPPLSGASITAALMVLALVAQALVGAANIWFEFTPALRALHLAAGTALWGIAVVVAATSLVRAAPVPAAERGVAAS